MKQWLMASVLLALLPPVFALDAACDPLIKSSEAKISQVAWHSITESEGLKLEAIKLDGQFFMKIDGKWQKFPIDLDEAEKTAITQMQEGNIKITDCKDEGTETVDGMEMNLLSFITEIPDSGIPAAKALLSIGKEDGLPYQSSSADTLVTYRYKDVVAPEL